MPTNEMAILMSIVLNKELGKELTNNRLDSTGKRVSYLCDSLVRRGYLRGNRIKRYPNVSNVRATLLEFLQENNARPKEAIEKLKKLVEDYNNELDKLFETAEQSSP